MLARDCTRLGTGSGQGYTLVLGNLQAVNLRASHQGRHPEPHLGEGTRQDELLLVAFLLADNLLGACLPAAFLLAAFLLGDKPETFLEDILQVGLLLVASLVRVGIQGEGVLLVGSLPGLLLVVGNLPGLLLVVGILPGLRRVADSLLVLRRAVGNLLGVLVDSLLGLLRVVGSLLVLLVGSLLEPLVVGNFLERLLVVGILELLLVVDNFLELLLVVDSLGPLVVGILELLEEDNLTVVDTMEDHS